MNTKRVRQLKRKKEDSKSLPSTWFSEACKWAGRGLVIGLLAYLPWFYGLVTWGQQVLLVPWMSLILGATWLHIIGNREIRFRLSPLVVSLILLLLMAFIQILPLPDLVYQTLAPTAKLEQSAIERAADYLSVEPTDPALTEASQNTGPIHRTLSISPIQTRASIVGWSSAVILLICSSLLFRDKTGRMLLLVCMSLISTCVATVGVMQSISWNQWSLVGETGLKGFATFVSRNSAPQYLAIGIGCTIAFAMAWLAQKRRKLRHAKRYRANNWVTRIRYAAEDSFREIDAIVILVAVAMVIQIAGVIGAASRGGFVALIFALCVTLLLTLGRSRKVQVSGIAGAALLAALILMFANSMELDEEIYARLEIEQLDSQIRWDFWKLALSQSEFWLTGCGLGNFHFAIMHANVQHPYWIYHAESIFVELISNFGAVGLVIALAGLLWLMRQILGPSQTKSVRFWPAVLYSVCAIALHSLVDFSLIIPAIFLSLSAVVGVFLGELEQTKGEQSKVEHQRPVDDSSGSLKNRLFATSVFVLLAVSLWQGAGPLIGFAQAERLEAEDWESSPQSAIVGKLLPTKVGLDHPEVVLQLAKQKCTAIESRLLNSVNWPDDVSPKEKADYSRLEFVNAIIRSPEENRRAKLKKQWQSDQALIASMAAAAIGFEFSTRHSLYDWRGHWGQFQTRSDSNKFAHALMCARLQILTNSMPSMQQAVGTCELLAQNRTIGLHYWKSCLANHPEQTFKVAVLVGNFLEYEEVASIVPDGEIPKAVLCRTLLQSDTTREIGQRLLDKIEIPAAIEEAVTEFDWNVVVWLAQSRGHTEGYILGLRRLAGLKPMDKNVRVRLAESLESIGAFEEAIQMLEQANRRTVLSPSEEVLLGRLRSRGNPPP